MHHRCVLYAAASTLDQSESLDRVESTASKQENELNMYVPQFGALNETVSHSSESTIPYVPPLPKVRSPVRSPRKTLNDSTPPGLKSKKKGGLPRVATLAQPSPKSKLDSKKSPPPFRTGGKVGTGWNREASGQAARKPTPTRGSSAALRETSKISASSSLASRSSTADAMILPRRTSSPRAGSRRTIVKPPDSITRAIKESQELSKRDSLDSGEDTDMQHLREILNDIKTIKSELGVESSKAEQDGEDKDGEVAESVLRTESPIANVAAVEKIEQIQSEDITVSYMTDGPVDLNSDEKEEEKPDPGDDEAEGPCHNPEVMGPAADESKEETGLSAPETTTDREIDQEETKQSSLSTSHPEMTKESSSCLCCSIM